MTDETALFYLNSFNKYRRIDLSERYPSAPPEAIDLLDKMLKFSPFSRCSIEEAINHDLFKDIKMKDQIDITPITLQFETQILTRQRLRKYFIDEIMYHQNKMTGASS